MKVITMESSAYKAMMEQIAEVAGYVREIREAMKRENTDRLLDTNEAARELGVSKRTLQRMRDDHRIRYVVLRRKCQYRLSEIRRILDSHTIREDGSGRTAEHSTNCTITADCPPETAGSRKEGGHEHGTADKETV